MRAEYRNGDSISLVHTGCDGCSPATVNGILCHEHGCPDAWRDRTAECFECGCDFYPSQQHQRTCDDCAREGDPDESVTAGIRYFNCPTCDQTEYLWSVNH